MAYNKARFKRDVRNSWKDVKKKAKKFARTEWNSGFDPYKSFWPLFVLIATIGLFIIFRLPYLLIRLRLRL